MEQTGQGKGKYSLEEMQRIVQRARERQAVAKWYPSKIRPNASPDDSQAVEAAPWENPFLAFNADHHPDATAAHAKARDWVYRVSSGERLGLVLWANGHRGQGGYGSGKTLLATMAYEFLRVVRSSKGDPQRVHMMGAVDYFQRIKDAYATDEPIEPLYRQWQAGHFIMDDWGKQYTTVSGAEWARSEFYKLINRLYEGGHGLLITSNEAPAQIESMIGGASWSRLMGMCGPTGFVDLSAVPDYRLKQWGDA